MMLPGSANFGGLSEQQRNAIVEALLTQAGTGALAPTEPFLNPYQDIVDPSDPASYDSTLGDIVAGFPAPTVHNPNNVIDPSDLMTAPPAEITDTGLNVSTNSPQNEAHNANVQAALNEAIAANITGPVADIDEGGQTVSDAAQAVSNNAVNDAVSSALADAIAASPSGDVSSGFGTGTGFSSADAANSAVSGALADAGIAAGVAGLGDSSGDSSGGGGGGGGGGSGK